MAGLDHVQISNCSKLPRHGERRKTSLLPTKYCILIIIRQDLPLFATDNAGGRETPESCSRSWSCQASHLSMQNSTKLQYSPCIFCWLVALLGTEPMFRHCSFRVN